jgi:serine/threonine-protein kinase RsbT
VRAQGVKIGFSLVDQTKIITAVSEIARNTVEYGSGGTLRIEVLREGARRGLRLIFEDRGPGIPDVNQALTDRWMSGKGLGLGLSGTKRLSNEFEIQSEPGKGATVTLVRWK